MDNLILWSITTPCTLIYLNGARGFGEREGVMVLVLRVRRGVFYEWGVMTRLTYRNYTCYSLLGSYDAVTDLSFVLLLTLLGIVHLCVDTSSWSWRQLEAILHLSGVPAQSWTWRMCITGHQHQGWTGTDGNAGALSKGVPVDIFSAEDEWVLMRRPWV